MYYQIDVYIFVLIYFLEDPVNVMHCRMLRHEGGEASQGMRIDPPQFVLQYLPDKLEEQWCGLYHQQLGCYALDCLKWRL